MADTTKFTITLNGTDWDGDYVWDLDRVLNGDDLHVIKQFSGVRLGEISDALGAGDYDLMCALAAVMLRRYGKAAYPQLLAIAGALRSRDVGAVTFEEVEVEEDDRPPASATLTGSLNENAEPSVATVSSVISSPGSNGTGAVLPEIPQSPTGSPGSEGVAA